MPLFVRVGVRVQFRGGTGRLAPVQRGQTPAPTGRPVS